uniref:Uncharacterized protein n=1 Tax=Rhizophora mucronata TaxID=61149 RepID=A0A2P2Q0G6_RHIMU
MLLPLLVQNLLPTFHRQLNTISRCSLFIRQEKIVLLYNNKQCFKVLSLVEPDT